MRSEDQFYPSSLSQMKISHLCSFILPYFLFFSPYIILKLSISFLSPLSTTTFLLTLFIIFFFTPISRNQQNNDDDGGGDDEEFPHITPQHLEWFNIVFHTPSTSSHDHEGQIEPQEQEPQTKDIIIQVVSNNHPHTQNGITPSKEATTTILEINNSLPYKPLFEQRYDTAINNNNVVAVGSYEDKMDLLWETYEDKELMVSMMGNFVEDNNQNGRSSSKKKDLRSLVNQNKEMKEEEEEENGKICCLQAFKFSSGKMRFGMGKKSGLMKISKAFKRLKFLHQLTNNGKNSRS